MSALRYVIPIVIICWSISGCKSASKVSINPQQSTSVDGLPMLLGRIDRNSLNAPNYQSWFQREYNDYRVQTKILDDNKLNVKGITIEVFMGTWCEDSQREVPHFYKIMDYLKADDKILTVIAVDDHPDRLKTSPQGEERGKNIEFVPTFIFRRNGTEIGRIVEMPRISLEADMIEIITK